MEGDQTNGILNEFNTLNNATDWNPVPGCDINVDFSDASKGSCKGWNRPGVTKTTMSIRYEHWYPNIEPDVLFEFISNLESRIVWDHERWTKGKIVEKKANSTIVNWTTPKPPIPLVNSRDMLVEFFSCPNGAGEGRHVAVGKSVDHPDCKPPSGWGSNERANVIIFGTVIEKNPNGPGSKMSSVRLVDMGGKFPAVAITKGSENAPLKEFEKWSALIDQRLAGKI